jgi:hypothetical protein
LEYSMTTHADGGSSALTVAVAGAVADGLVGHPMFTTDYLEAVVRPAAIR